MNDNDSQRPGPGHNNPPAEDEFREPTDSELALRVPPRLADKIEIEGLSFTEAMAHPEIGPALELFHDLAKLSQIEREIIEALGRGERPDEVARQFTIPLRWARDIAEGKRVSGAVGVAKFLLAHAVHAAGFRLRALPPTPKAIESIWARTTQMLASKYQAAYRVRYDSHLGGSLRPVLIAPTIAGSKTLLAHAVQINLMILKAFGMVRMGNTDVSGFEQYADKVTGDIEAAAIDHDPQQSKFTTRIHPRVKGGVKDWLSLRKKIEPLDKSHKAESDRTSRIDGVLSFPPSEDDTPGGQNSEWVAWAANRYAANDRYVVDDLQERLKRVVSATEWSDREKIILDNLLYQKKQWKALAAELGISEGNMNLQVHRLKEKLKTPVRSADLAR